MGYIFVADSIWVALQIFEQFCPKAGDANPLVAEPETDLGLQSKRARVRFPVGAKKFSDGTCKYLPFVELLLY